MEEKLYENCRQRAQGSVEVLELIPPKSLQVQALSAEDFAPYGSLLGGAVPVGSEATAFSDRGIDFWQEHIFDPGLAGEVELLRVNYRNRDLEVSSLEMHRLSQQAVIPLSEAIIQVVVLSLPDGLPDLGSVRAFRVGVGEGICMRSECWHTTRVETEEARCLMLTRSSTTVDLIAHLKSGRVLSESVIAVVDQFTISR